MLNKELEHFPPTHTVLSEAQFQAEIIKQDEQREKNLRLIRRIKLDLRKRGIIGKGTRIYKGHDIHAFIPKPKDLNSFYHLQLHTHRDSLTTINITLEEMDKRKLTEARKLASVGNEQTAITRRFIRRQPILDKKFALTDLLMQVLSPEPLTPPAPKTLSPNWVYEHYQTTAAFGKVPLAKLVREVRMS